MKTMLSQIDLIIECRDYRVPLTSRNPLFEESLAGRQRLIVYTKRDLGSNGKAADVEREAIISRWHAPSLVLFSNHKERKDVRRVLDFAKQTSSDRMSLTGSRMMIVGMPNVGKSSLLNALRHEGVGRGKVAQTGAQPGVTRKIGSGVKIEDPDEAEGKEGIYLVDTPGVFVPYVPNAEAMLKLALCGSVKDTIIPPTTLADYLLYRVNHVSPSLYREYSPPTNDIVSLLEAIARKTGRLQKGGVPDTESCALWMVQRWRNGLWGRFVLDEVTEDGLERMEMEGRSVVGSMNQARKKDKELKREKSKMRHAMG
ncbi:Mitochondrial GTPase 1 [Elasticomyces elasticus]|nr:Mitochondrial GTPase 1 [Elasticomyces elasticus]